MWAGHRGIEVLDGVGPAILWTSRGSHASGVWKSLQVPPLPLVAVSLPVPFPAPTPGVGAGQLSARILGTLALEINGGSDNNS